MRTIRRIFKAPKVNMGGLIIDQPLPANGIDQIDPFLLIHHWHRNYHGGQLQRDVGVGPHPHRGFAPVTFIFKGGVHHRDSLGNNSIVLAGGTQWMNSGKGIIHSERPTKQIAEEGGEFEIIQFWVNVPAKNKMETPVYFPVSEKETPYILSDDKKTKVYVVTGKFMGVGGILKTHTPIQALRINIDTGGTFTIPTNRDFNTIIYQLDGQLIVNNVAGSTEKNLIWFNNDGTNITIEAQQQTRAILLSGIPIGEEVTTHGPFVMNTQTEILVAMRDYQQGRMGILIEDFI